MLSENGVCLLTENRKDEGLVLAMPVRVNVTLTDLARVSRAGLLRRQMERDTADRWIRELDIRLRSIEQTARELSGGNQQKVIIAKWLFRNASILMLDEPTRGIDVGAKAEVYTLLRRLSADGKALLVVSSELPELMMLCGRILVLSRGRLVGDLSRHDFDEERILSLAYSEYLARNHHQDRFYQLTSPCPKLIVGVADEASPSKHSKKEFFQRFLQDAGIGVAVLLLVVVFSVTAPHFTDESNITNILTQITINLIMATGMTFVILVGGIDLSVGSVMALCAMVAGLVLDERIVTNACCDRGGSSRQRNRRNGLRLRKWICFELLECSILHCDAWDAKYRARGCAAGDRCTHVVRISKRVQRIRHRDCARCPGDFPRRVSHGFAWLGRFDDRQFSDDSSMPSATMTRPFDSRVMTRSASKSRRS